MELYRPLGTDSLLMLLDLPATDRHQFNDDPRDWSLLSNLLPSRKQQSRNNSLIRCSVTTVYLMENWTVI